MHGLAREVFSLNSFVDDCYTTQIYDETEE